MTTLLTASQVAVRLDVSERSIRRYTADGDIPAHNFNGRNYYDWEEVCEAVFAMQQEAERNRPYL